MAGAIARVERHHPLVPESALSRTTKRKRDPSREERCYKGREKESILVSHPTTRRFFIGAATAAAATRVWGANDKINVAIVGLGGRGSNHLTEYSARVKGARVAALCDVNQAAREVAQATLLKNTSEKAK